MSYDIIAIPNFKREIKKLAKKYSSLKYDFAKVIDSLEENPTQGVSFGNNCFKIRMAITSKSKGKSSGSRIITHFKISQSTVYLLSIFDKSAKESISNKALIELLKEIPD